MKSLLMILSSFIVLQVSAAFAKPIPARVCQVMRAKQSGAFASPESLCRHFGEFACETWPEAICVSSGGNAASCMNTSLSEALCIAGGGNGASCMSVASVAEAVCEITDGNFCSSLSDSQAYNYIELYNMCVDR